MTRTATQPAAVAAPASGTYRIDATRSLITFHDQAPVRREAMLTARRPAFGGYRHDEWHPGASVAADVRRRRNLRKSQPACPARSFRRSRIQLLALPRSSPAAMQWVHAKHGLGGPVGQGHGFQAASARCRRAHRPVLAVR